MVLTRLIYASKLNFSPKDPNYSRVLVEILMRSRKYNKDKSITSALFISNNSCIHVIEGDSTELARLMFNVSRDNRHSHLKILHNKRIDKRIYNEWSMKLLTAGTNSYTTALEKLENLDEEAYLNIAKFTNGAFEEIRTLEKFDSQAESQNPHTAKTYKDSILSIEVWPKASQIKLKNRGTLLCSILLNKDMTFNQISKRLTSVDEDELILDLQELDELGILKVKHNPEADTFSENIITLPEKQKKSRFSQLFKNFISANNHK